MESIENVRKRISTDKFKNKTIAEYLSRADIVLLSATSSFMICRNNLKSYNSQAPNRIDYNKKQTVNDYYMFLLNRVLDTLQIIGQVLTNLRQIMRHRKPGVDWINDMEQKLTECEKDQIYALQREIIDRKLLALHTKVTFEGVQTTYNDEVIKLYHDAYSDFPNLEDSKHHKGFRNWFREKFHTK